MRQPSIGRPGRVDGTRELVIHRYPYILVYRVTSDTVDVLSVYHDARAWPESFEG